MTHAPPRVVVIHLIHLYFVGANLAITKTIPLKKKDMLPFFLLPQSPYPSVSFGKGKRLAGKSPNEM